LQPRAASNAEAVIASGIIPVALNAYSTGSIGLTPDRNDRTTWDNAIGILPSPGSRHRVADHDNRCLRVVFLFIEYTSEHRLNAERPKRPRFHPRCMNNLRLRSVQKPHSSPVHSPLRIKMP